MTDSNLLLSSQWPTLQLTHFFSIVFEDSHCIWLETIKLRIVKWAYYRGSLFSILFGIADCNRIHQVDMCNCPLPYCTMKTCVTNVQYACIHVEWDFCHMCWRSYSYKFKSKNLLYGLNELNWSARGRVTVQWLYVCILHNACVIVMYGLYECKKGENHNRMTDSNWVSSSEGFTWSPDPQRASYHFTTHTVMTRTIACFARAATTIGTNW